VNCLTQIQFRAREREHGFFIFTILFRELANAKVLENKIA